MINESSPPHKTGRPAGGRGGGGGRPCPYPTRDRMGGLKDADWGCPDRRTRLDRPPALSVSTSEGSDRRAQTGFHPLERTLYAPSRPPAISPGRAAPAGGGDSPTASRAPRRGAATVETPRDGDCPARIAPGRARRRQSARDLRLRQHHGVLHRRRLQVGTFVEIQKNAPRWPPAAEIALHTFICRSA